MPEPAALHRFVEGLRLAAWLVDSDGALLAASPEGAAALGLAPGQAVGQTGGAGPGTAPTRLETLVAPEEAPALRAALAAAASGREASFRAGFRNADGALVSRDCDLAPAPRLAADADADAGAEDGAAPGGASGPILVQARPTAAGEVAADLRLAQERLNLLADNAPGALYEYLLEADGARSIPYFSANLPDMLGVPRERLLRSEGLENIHPDDLDRFEDTLRRSAETLSPFVYRFRIRHEERGERALIASSRPVRQECGGIRWYGALLDVTDQQESARRAAETEETLARANDRFSAMAENAPGAIFECRRDAGGGLRYVFFNSRLPELVGVSAEEIARDGAAVHRHVPEEDRRRVADAISRAMRDGTVAVVRHRVMHPDAGLRWVTASIRPSLQQDDTLTLYGNAMDITERVQSEARAEEAAEEVRRAHERLNLTADVAPVGLFEMRRDSDGGVVLSYASAGFEDLIGMKRAEIEQLGIGVFERIFAEDREMVFAVLDESQDSLSPVQVRFRIAHPERGLIWVSAFANPPRFEGACVVWAAALLDVTMDVLREDELRMAHEMAERMREENERQALQDGLTGLPNRRAYDRQVEARLEGARGSGPRDAVIVRIDLDHFKHVNDTLGHEAGDAVLVRVADILREAAGPGDFAARIGGDEYSILLAPGQGMEEASALCARIQDGVAQPFFYEGRQCRYGASIGVAESEDFAAEGADLPVFADAALYRAKEGGRNRVELFTPALRADVLGDRRLATELQEALERDEFEPWFQPQIRAADDRLTGVETLLRWRRPDGAVLAPAAFMHMAEQLRIVPEIDRIMMQKTRGALSRWRAAGACPPKISFNVSSGRMQDPDVVDMARRIAADDVRVVFELLESILVEEESEAFRFHLDQVREAGIEIEIDDFGSGHASIISVMEIEPTALKIDRRITRTAAGEGKEAALVRAIVEIAETLGIGTVAEGVETAEQAEILRRIGCDVLQGYYYSRPLDEAAMQRFTLDWAERAA